MKSRYFISSKGFTLIELVVVIVILGILAAVAAPKFMDLQKDARIAYLNGIKGAVLSANEMLHAYAIVHGLENVSLDKTSGDKTAAVRFDGSKIVPSTTGDLSNGTFFLNYGYVAVTYGTDRNSGLVQIIGRDAVSIKGSQVSVKNDYITSSNFSTKQCTSDNKNVDICYFYYGTRDNNTDGVWSEAYIVLKGFTASDCSLHYVAAKKDSNGTIIPPQVTLNTDGC